MSPFGIPLWHLRLWVSPFSLLRLWVSPFSFFHEPIRKQNAEHYCGCPLSAPCGFPPFVGVPFSSRLFGGFHIVGVPVSFLPGSSLSIGCPLSVGVPFQSVSPFSRPVQLTSNTIVGCEFNIVL